MKIATLTWEQTIPVRHAVLWPEKPPEFCQVDGDEQGLHFGIFDNDMLVCVASLYEKDNTVRLRKFATLENYQGKGLGTMLLQHMIQTAKENGLTTIWCDARESAVSFYAASGLQVRGERFMKSGEPYFRMSLPLD